MNLIKFQPHTRNRVLTDPFDRIFNRSLGEFVGADMASNVPSVNVVQDDRGFQIELAAPGLTKEDFKINVDKNRLTISAENKVEERDERPSYTRREFNYSAFTRSFHLPKAIDKDGITASYENGILNLSLPKKEEVVKEEQVRTIEIG